MRCASAELELITPFHARAFIAHLPLRWRPRLAAFVDARRVVVGDEGPYRTGKSFSSASVRVPGRVVRRGRCGADVGDTGVRITTLSRAAPARCERSQQFESVHEAGARTNHASRTVVLIAIFRCGAFADERCLVAGAEGGYRTGYSFSSATARVPGRVVRGRPPVWNAPEVARFHGTAFPGE